MLEELSMRRFGEKLRYLRKQRSWTLKEFATCLGRISHGYISEIETGKKIPTLGFVLMVSRILDVPVDQLVKDELEVKIEKRYKISIKKRS